MSKASRERFVRGELFPVEGGQSVRSKFKDGIDARIARAADAPIDECLGMTIAVRVGPEEAAVLLSYSRGNRNEADSTVAMYERDMVSGQWTEENGNPLLFTRSGRLGNGHHRLNAVVRSGATIRMVLSFGNPEEAMDVADGGRPRSIADRLQLRGRHNTHKRVAALRMTITLCAGSAHTVKRSLGEIEEAEKVHASAIQGLDRYMGSKYPASFWGSLILAHPVDPGAVEALAEEVLKGEGVSGPAYTIREYIIHTKSAGQQHQMAVALRTLYAVRAYIERRPLSKFAPKKDDTHIFDWFRARRAPVVSR